MAESQAYEQDVANSVNEEVCVVPLGTKNGTSVYLEETTKFVIMVGANEIGTVIGHWKNNTILALNEDQYHMINPMGLSIGLLIESYLGVLDS